MTMFVKIIATLTVLVANTVICVCMLLLYQLVEQVDNMKYILAVSCTFLLCLLVLITATLDNISWWSNSFPDAFMTPHSVKELLNRFNTVISTFAIIQKLFQIMCSRAWVQGDNPTGFLHLGWREADSQK